MKIRIKKPKLKGRTRRVKKTKHSLYLKVAPRHFVLLLLMGLVFFGVITITFRQIKEGTFSWWNIVLPTMLFIGSMNAINQIMKESGF